MEESTADLSVIFKSLSAYFLHEYKSEMSRLSADLLKASQNRFSFIHLSVDVSNLCNWESEAAIAALNDIELLERVALSSIKNLLGESGHNSTLDLFPILHYENVPFMRGLVADPKIQSSVLKNGGLIVIFGVVTRTKHDDYDVILRVRNYRCPGCGTEIKRLHVLCPRYTKCEVCGTEAIEVREERSVIRKNSPHTHVEKARAM